MDLIDLDRKLQENTTRARRREKLHRDESQLLKQLLDVQETLQAWRVTIGKADRKLDNLDSAGLGYLFGTLFGDRQDRIADEQERLLKQKLQHEECAEALEPLQQDLAATRRELAELVNIEDQRVSLLAEKEQLLRSRDDELAAKLLDSGEQLAELVSLDREIQAAVTAGKFVLAHLEVCRVDLESARSWGRFDMCGGGPFSAIARHGKINEAREHVHQAQLCLRTFIRELRDVEPLFPDIPMSLEGFDGLSSFADIFFDGLIVDWFVRSRLGTCIQRVDEADYKIRSIAHELWKRGVDVVKQRDELHVARQALIEQAG